MTKDTTQAPADQNPIGRVGPELSPNQDIFAEQLLAVMSQFGKACSDHDARLVVSIVTHAKLKHPLVYCNGHKYDLAELVTRIGREMKIQLIEELEGHSNRRE